VPRPSRDGAVPKRATLYEVAAAQAGYFSLEQAREAGFSRQLLQYRIRNGEIERSIRGVYRLVQFPASDREDLVPIWLWSNQQGVFGLETALAIHDLSDVLPAQHDIFVPTSWAKRRVTAPPGVRVHIADVPLTDRQWHGPVPVTTPIRTLRDCVKHHEPRDLVEQALDEAVERRLITRNQARSLLRDAS
jgi:predicted transcriptional regulator of viral defense system